MPAAVVDGALTRQLRRSVLRPDSPLDAPLPADDVDGVVHFAKLSPDGRPVSTCLLFLEQCPWRPASAAGPDWHLRQMATDPAERGHGYAAEVLVAVLDYVATQGGGVLWCYARAAAVTLYERAGLTGHGEVFVEESTGIEHLRMWRSVAPTPSLSR